MNELQRWVLIRVLVVVAVVSSGMSYLQAHDDVMQAWTDAPLTFFFLPALLLGAAGFLSLGGAESARRTGFLTSKQRYFGVCLLVLSVLTAAYCAYDKANRIAAATEAQEGTAIISQDEIRAVIQSPLMQALRWSERHSYLGRILRARLPGFDQLSDAQRIKRINDLMNKHQFIDIEREIFGYRVPLAVIVMVVFMFLGRPMPTDSAKDPPGQNEPG